MFDAVSLRATLDRLLADLPERRYCVAFSGGVDSTALLHALAESRTAAPALTVRAVHVNHHLQPHADSWAAHARRVAAQVQVPLTILETQVAANNGESIEALARERRYARLGAELTPGEVLLTAHHRDDQLETFLLQLLRGAGVAGLAAMPARTRFAGGWHVRPLLEVTRAALVDYVRRHALPWVEDASNAETRFDRSFLRQSVLPGLRERWPGIAANVARSAGHMAEARELLDEVARGDMLTARDGDTLQCAALRALAPAHARNLVRYWLRSQGLIVPSSARLEQIVSGVLHARVDAMPAVRWPSAEVRRYRDRLYALSPLAPAPKSSMTWDWKSRPSIDLGAGIGTLRVTQSGEAGLRLCDLPCPLRIEWRSAGAKLKPAPDRPARTLRYLFQEAGVVPWMRARIPLLVSGERLIAVGDLYADIQHRGASGAGSVGLEWRDHGPIY